MNTFRRISLGVRDGTADAAMEKPAENNARLHDSCIGNHAPENGIVRASVRRRAQEELADRACISPVKQVL